MSESVKVMVRCRPFISKQESQKSGNIVKVDVDLHQISISKPKSISQQPRIFTFDHIFDTESSQTEVYEQTAFLLVENVLEGYNGTIFAYGQTGCGKTYTMTGLNTEEKRGVIPRTFRQVMTMAAVEKDKKHLIRCSYIEIYNEQIYDLFEKKSRTKLELIETPAKGTFIRDQKPQIVRNLEELTKLFEQGSKNRAIRATSFNKNSSRSHCVFTLYVESSEVDEKGNELFKAAKLNLVDLAGSERQSKIKHAGEGLKETTRINLSLSALGNVISSLADGKATHIPYRDSKLTRLLSDSLGGNTKTIMIATISPTESSYEYASRAKYIKNKPVINQDPKDTLLREYAEEIKRLKRILEDIHPDLLNEGKLAIDPSQLQEYKKREQMDRQEKQELKKKLDSLEKLLTKEELEEDLNEMEKIKKLREKLKEQREKEEEYLRDKKQREEELLHLETNYKSLNEEVDLLRERFHELKSKYLQAQEEIKDLRQSSEEEKQNLLSQIRDQNLEISKYRGIVENILNEQQVQHVLKKSFIDEDEGEWKIAKFHMKENIVIFPEKTARSLGDLMKKEKVNMYVTESKSNKPPRSEVNLRKNLTNVTDKTKESFSLNELRNNRMKRNVSLNSQSQIKSTKQLNPLRKIPPNQKKSITGNNEENKKKLNIDLSKLKMDILTELGKRQKN